MANMRDVAKAANVSVSTVSAVFSEKKFVRPALKERILQAAAAVGYSPAAKARQTAGMEIAVILPGVYSSYFSPLLSGMADRAGEAGAGLLLYDSGRNPQTERQALALLERRGVTDLILDSVCPSDEQLFSDLRARFVEKGAARVAILSRKLSMDGLFSIFVDHARAAYLATKHLIARGHTKIAHIRGDAVFPHAALRERGFRQALFESGIPVDERLVLTGDFTPVSGYAAATELFAKGIFPTAVFSANDQMAVGAIKAIRQQGLSVPEDVALVGFDDLAVSSLVSPGLTTVQYPIYQMGYLAVDLLLKARSGENVPAQTELPARLIVRRSSDPAAQDDWNLQNW